MQPLWASPTPLPGAYGQQVVQHTGELANFIRFQSRMNHLFSMVGTLNKLPVAASGMIFFDDPITLGSISAIGVGFFAGVIYAVAKNNQKKTEGRMQADVIIPLTNRKA